jgi:hypothetical protein
MNQGKRRGPTITKKGLTGHQAVDVHQLSTNGFCFLLHGPEHGLGGLKAFPELLRLQDRVRVQRGPEPKER